MGILQIAPATRTGMRFIISLYGMSETGKTLSALKLAAGLEPDPTKRGLLDTEGGQRGRAYVDQVPGGYMYASLSAPFTPERYIEALGEFEAAGINVLTIDSVSHAWFAEGGVLDMVEAATETNDMAKWAKPKRRLSKMTRRILSGDMHIILCSRGKQPLVDNGKGTNPRYTPGPVTPIQEKTLRFDMTIMAQMLGDGRFTVTAPAGKCPGALRPIFAAGEFMNEDMGKKLAAWIKGESVKTPAQRQLEIAATAAADEGLAALETFWKGIDNAGRAYLKPNIDNYKSIARAADEETVRLAAEAAGQGAPAAPDDDPFGSGAGQPVQPPRLVTSERVDGETGEATDSPILPFPAEGGDRNGWLVAVKAQIAAAKDGAAVTAISQALGQMAGDFPPVIEAEVTKALRKRSGELSSKAA